MDGEVVACQKPTKEQHKNKGRSQTQISVDIEVKEGEVSIQPPHSPQREVCHQHTTEEEKLSTQKKAFSTA